MIALSNAPNAEFFESQGLKMHYADRGNRDAPPLILIHGGRDHCRCWDWIAGALKDDFHVIAPDLRGHGDSEWAKGSSYSLADHVYDLTRLLHSEEIRKASIVGHSMGGMVSLTFAGAFPERMSSLVVLDGVATSPSQSPRPIDRMMSGWIADLDKIAVSLDENIAMCSRIACPTLFLCGSESSLTDPRTVGVFENFSNAEVLTIEGAGHWLHHDKPDEMIRRLRDFLAASVNDEGQPTTSSRHRS